MARRYAKSSLNFTQAMEALKTGAVICTPIVKSWEIDLKHSYGSYVAGGAAKWSAWPVDHRTMTALHRRGLLVKTQEFNTFVEWKLKPGVN